MADGVPGPKKAAAVQLVEGENRGVHGSATVRNLRVEELNVLGHQSKSPTATLSVAVMGESSNISKNSISSSGQWGLGHLV